MRFMQIESVLQTINRSEPAKNRFSVALVLIGGYGHQWQTMVPPVSNSQNRN